MVVFCLNIAFFQIRFVGFIPNLMCEADYLLKLRAICVICGKFASYTKRTTSETTQVVIGELNKYEARCRNCYSLK